MGCEFAARQQVCIQNWAVLLNIFQMPLAPYTNLLTSCKLTSYLADIDKQAEDMFFRLVKQLAEKEGVTEQLKAENQMLWVKRMNNIRNRATEIVNAELIYT